MAMFNNEIKKKEKEVIKKRPIYHLSAISQTTVSGLTFWIVQSSDGFHMYDALTAGEEGVIRL